MRARIALSFVLAAALLPAPALAQDEAARIAAPIIAPPPPAPPSGPTSATLSVSLRDLEGEALANRFADLRLSHRRARETEGYVLLAYGAASIVMGALAAGIGYQDERWLGFGLGSAVWGVLNAAFCPIFFDLDGGTLRRIEADRGLRGDALDRAREDWAAAQYGTATTIAVNAGLDIFYIATGILLFVIADQMTPDLQWLEGYAIAMTAQGTGLLAFDLPTWIAAQQRGDETRMLFREEAEGEGSAE